MKAVARKRKILCLSENGIGFDTYERTIHDACNFTVEVGTNGYKGGNAKKRLKNYALN